MKRNSKPFAVEIKKSRGPGQPHHLPPRRLFEMVAAAVPKIVHAEEPQAVVEATAGPRILPSIVEPAWSTPEPAEPVRRKRSSGARSRAGQIEIDRHGTVAKGVTDGTTAAKPRTSTLKPPHRAEEDASSAAKPDGEQRLTLEEPASGVASPRADHHRLTRRQAAAVHLPRNERWKRRLHPAAW